jgi:hypothetical protein
MSHTPSWNCKLAVCDQCCLPPRRPDAINFHDGQNPNKALRPTLTITYATGARSGEVHGQEVATGVAAPNASLTSDGPTTTGGLRLRAASATVVACAGAAVILLAAGVVAALWRARHAPVAKPRAWHGVAGPAIMGRAAGTTAKRHHAQRVVVRAQHPVDDMVTVGNPVCSPRMAPLAT